MYASYLRQTYFDMPIHVFRFCILTKLVLGIIVKNNDIYISFMYIGLISICNMLQVVLVSFFCIWMSFGQNVFSYQKSKFWKIRVLFFGKIYKSQKWFKKFEICVEFFHTCLIFKVLY